jgi:RNA polymerase sigma-70 factor (TIGR02943 family)
MDTFIRQLTTSRTALLRTAHSRLRNSDWAEDAVSETLLAALQKRPNFVDAGRIRAWLFGILRHKVVDQLRQQLGNDGVQMQSDGDEDEPREPSEACTRSDPVRRLVDRQFITALHGQLKRLPQTHAQAFLMRECMGHDTVEVCDELAISAGNLAVMVHRTRQRLQQGLSEHHV